MLGYTMHSPGLPTLISIDSMLSLLFPEHRSRDLALEVTSMLVGPWPDRDI